MEGHKFSVRSEIARNIVGKNTTKKQGIKQDEA